MEYGGEQEVKHKRGEMRVDGRLDMTESVLMSGEKEKGRGKHEVKQREEIV